MNANRAAIAVCCCLFSLASLHRAGAQSAPGPVGLFESHGDVGSVLHPGSVEYDESKRTYMVSGSGENMWFAADAFQFAWKKVSGDVVLTADVSFAGTGGNAHRKAVVMVRQSLAADSAYADVALHGDGLTSLQCRDEKGANTREVQANVAGPKRLRIEKRGQYVFMSLGTSGGDVQFTGGSMRLALQEPFYVGIGVCAHDKDAVETAVFSNVELTTPESRAGALYSTLETVPVSSGDRRVVYVARGRFEAPNWSRDGASLLFNRNGRIERVPVAGGKPEAVDTGFAVNCNSRHGISPDGALLAISDDSRERGRPAIYTVPAGGGEPRRVTRNAPSYWHGWSPDGKTIAFSGERNGRVDIYTIPAAGGDETRLTTAEGVNDGPEYSPDGNYIYFHSGRTGTMQIWRMRADGSGQEQITSDEFNNRFPHVSPDGQRIAFLSYGKEIKGDPREQDVSLRILTLSDRKVAVLARLVGGQGTLDAPSWSPDSRRLAFVSYHSLPEPDKR